MKRGSEDVKGSEAGEDHPATVKGKALHLPLSKRFQRPSLCYPHLSVYSAPYGSRQGLGSEAIKNAVGRLGWEVLEGSRLLGEKIEGELTDTLRADN